MRVTIGTFNLNNLFSRFNFRADVGTAAASDRAVESRTEFRFDDPSGFKLRTYQGRLVRGKPTAERALLASRITRMNVDVLAVQEAEDIDTLKAFNRDDLLGLYDHVVLIEGNDPRLIDVGLLSKLPIGGVTSWRHRPDPEAPGRSVFSRDLLEVEVLSADRQRRLFTLYNNHLKSRFVPFNVDPVAGREAADRLRLRQAAAVEAIVEARTRPNGRFVIVGDLNDRPTAEGLAPIASGRLNLVNALAGAVESIPFADDPPPPPAPWTHRFKPSNQPAEYELFDQVWASPALSGRITRAVIERRTRKSGDGTDHDPAWVEFDL